MGWGRGEWGGWRGKVKEGVSIECNKGGWTRV